MKRTLCFLLCIPLYVLAQEKQTGILWTEGLTWEQIKAKAKTENKYIFIDAFTTWCGPCKVMDKKVYVNDTVGDFFNDRFISVKVQMDKTDKDDDNIKNWYSTAAAIEREYKIAVFPTYIFLSPDGIWVHKEEGMKGVREFIAVAQKALQPGRVYNDPNQDFYDFAKEFAKGKREFNKMPAMHKRAVELGEADIANNIRDAFREYLLKQDKSAWYQKEPLEYLTAPGKYISSTSPFFVLFHPDGSKVNKILKKRDVAEKIVCNTIFIEKVEPFFASYQFVDTGNSTKRSVAAREPNWSKLEQSILAEYNKGYTSRSILNAKIHWYEAKNGEQPLDKFYQQQVIKYYFQYLDKYGIDTVDTNSRVYDGAVNDYSWKTFLTIDDRKILETATKWMKIIVGFRPESYTRMDTYANLLYKQGKTKEAIFWEEKALALTIKYPHHLGNDELAKFYAKALAKMKRGEPTWKSQQ